MLVEHAKDIARAWVREHAPAIPGYVGAFSHGSVNWLPGDAALPPASDVDVLVVVAGANPPHKPGKLRYRDVLLEVSYLPSERVQSPERILGDYHLAGSFSLASILADPSGRLARLQAVVAAGYAQPHWVRARCQHAEANILRHLDSLRESAPLHEQVTGFAFAAGVTAHVLLVAGLQNPTVRRRYVAVRQLLVAYGQADFYPSLLALLGCAEMSQADVEQHLAALAGVFDAACAAIRTPFPFAADISGRARPIAIDGSRELIARGDHREAVFWILVTYARCLTVLHHDAPPELQERFRPGLLKLLAGLGITAPAGLLERGEQIRAFLPRLRTVADAILTANPSISGNRR